MRGCSVNINDLKSALLEFVENELVSLVMPGGQEAKPTAGFQRVVHRAAVHVQSAGKLEVTGANVLVAMFSERESHAAFFLQGELVDHGAGCLPVSHDRAFLDAVVTRVWELRDRRLTAFRGNNQEIMLQCCGKGKIIRKNAWKWWNRIAP